MKEEMTLEKWVYNYRRVKKEFWSLLVFLILIVLLIFYFPSSTNTDSESFSDFDNAIEEYEQTTGRKIYPSGREFLRKAADKKGLQTKDEVLNLIKYNEKFMFK